MLAARLAVAGLAGLALAGLAGLALAGLAGPAVAPLLAAALLAPLLVMTEREMMMDCCHCLRGTTSASPNLALALRLP